MVNVLGFLWITYSLIVLSESACKLYKEDIEGKGRDYKVVFVIAVAMMIVFSPILPILVILEAVIKLIRGVK